VDSYINRKEQSYNSKKFGISNIKYFDSDKILISSSFGEGNRILIWNLKTNSFDDTFIIHESKISNLDYELRTNTSISISLEEKIAKLFNYEKKIVETQYINSTYATFNCEGNIWIGHQKKFPSITRSALSLVKPYEPKPLMTLDFLTDDICFIKASGNQYYVYFRTSEKYYLIDIRKNTFIFENTFPKTYYSNHFSADFSSDSDKLFYSNGNSILKCYNIMHSFDNGEYDNHLLPITSIKYNSKMKILVTGSNSLLIYDII